MVHMVSLSSFFSCSESSMPCVFRNSESRSSQMGMESMSVPSMSKMAALYFWFWMSSRRVSRPWMLDMFLVIVVLF